MSTSNQRTSDSQQEAGDVDVLHGVPRKLITTQLIDIFKSTGTGEVLDYDEIGSRLGGIPLDGWQKCMPTVTRILREDYRIVLTNVRGLGYKHCSDLDVVRVSERNVHGIHCKVKKALSIHELGVKEPSKLPRTERDAHDARGSILRLVSAASSTKTERTLVASRVKNSEMDTTELSDMVRVLGTPKK